MEENKYPSIFGTPNYGMHFTVNISQVFGDAFTFDEVIHILTTATPDDNITIQINSDGGNLFSLIALRNAIRATQAKVHMSLLGMAASAGSALFLEGADSYCVHDNSCMMIHNMLCGTGYDDTQKIRTRAEHNMKINERFVKETYTNFLSEEEINDVIYNSREIYLEDFEIRERLSKREELKKKQFLVNLKEEMEEPLDLSELTSEELDEYLKAAQEDLKDIKAEVVKRKKEAVPEKPTVKKTVK